MQPMDTTAPEIKKVSVVDGESKVHDYENLWLGGCNVIPDSMGRNPTRTAVRTKNGSLPVLIPTIYADGLCY